MNAGSHCEPHLGSRQARKQATRRRLLETAMDLILEDGVVALTTGKIAAGAGIAQSGFYVHFDNLDACLAAIGDEIIVLVDMEAGLRRERLANLKPEQGLHDAIDRMHIVLSQCLARRREAVLLLRCRLDPGPLGEAVRRAVKRAQRLVVQDLWDVAAALGLRGAHLRDVELMAAMLVRAFLGALELCLLDDDQPVEAVAHALGTSQFHFAMAELARLRASQDQDQ